MKIKLLSDLHLDHAPFNYIRGEEDVLVIAGDITNGKSGIQFVKSLPKDLPIVVVLGNHDYYFNEYFELTKLWKDTFAETNVRFLQNEYVIIDGVKFIGGTMWSDFLLDGVVDGVHTEIWASKNVADFNEIMYRTGKWKVKHHKEMFNEFCKFLEFAYKHEYTDKCVVVSHFCPSALSIHEKYRETWVHSYWASNLHHMMYAADLWLHGHTHSSSDYNMDWTRVVCNPRGYGVENSSGFDENLIIKI